MIPAPYRGINLHPIWLTDAMIDQACALLTQSRAQLVRIDMPLNYFFTARGTLHPGYLERLQRFVKECPGEVLAIATYTPSWANGGQSSNVPWTSPADYGAAVTQLVETFPTIAAWELWNEPDLNYSWAWSTGTVEQRAQAYVRLLEAGSAAVRAANPKSKVVAPAISGTTSAPWLGAFYAANPHGLYDVFSAHVYGDPPSHGGLAPAEMVQAWTANIWPLIASNGDGLRDLWFTETGWNTSPTGVTVEQQAANLTATFEQIDVQVAAAHRLYWFSLNDARSGTTSPGDYYGLLDVNLAQKGDGSAWAAFNA